ncbi:TrkH family potassium uptake protein [Nocardiopsis sp. RSe5-2]|uniref:TrkH family potassium uptake protein n=1 Tax=Nocardiopsis endophytica TaxID=3018445 RepID=A0ABT4TZH8_9ACTN|nr:potassium transporter TrkG [Nocardiopsis endophytica]MDA2810098.1 TrkH family potassium uptake protein [Nocardiopsis endophytica]
MGRRTVAPGHTDAARGTGRRDDPLRGLWKRPASIFVLCFVAVDLAGAGLLMLPAAHAGGEGLTFVEALFTSTTALAVCGLSVIDLGARLTHFGEITVMVLIQIGGIGIMTLASVLGVVVIHRFGLRMQLSVQAETRALQVGDLRGVVGRVVVASLACEAAVAAVLVPRFWLEHGMAPLSAVYRGVFHSVSAFNNAGLSLYPDSLTRFAADPLVVLPAALATVLGGLGFPVLLELRRHLARPRRWTLHTKLTVVTTVLLFAGGAAAVTALEWNNPATLGHMAWWQRVLDGTFHGIMPRSGGFNVVDVGAMNDSTLMVVMMLMFVGGGSAGTAGGIKVATLAVILLVVWAEIRGNPHVHVFGRKLSPGVVRQSLSLLFLSMTVVVVSTVAVVAATPFELVPVLFEVISASGVVGLSMGITADLPPGAHILLVVLMVAGRIGPVTFAAALALRERAKRYDLPESRPIIG